MTNGYGLTYQQARLIAQQLDIIDIYEFCVLNRQCIVGLSKVNSPYMTLQFQGV